MERKYLKNLEDWINSKDRKPLLIYGARQVGKTYLVQNIFAKKYFPNRYLRIDCSEDIQFRDYVFKSDFSSTLTYIEARYNFKLDDNHLLIIDEAQECPPIIQMMKYFCEKRRDIPLIVTGSQVRNKLNRVSKTSKEKFLFPVGNINILEMKPLTFDEFLFNYNSSMFSFLKDSFIKKTPIDFALHNEILNIFYIYLFVGGMPEVVDTFLKYKDNEIKAYQEASKTIKDLYSTYINDMDLYQPSKDSIIRCKEIYENIYSQLNKENENFKVKLLNEKLSNRDYSSPIEWLITASIVNKSSLLKEKVTSPLINSDSNLYRLYLFDMGLFSFESSLNAKTFIINKDNSLSGIFFENYLSIELAARGFKLFYWKGKRNSEFEFIIDINGRIIPIDSKKSKGSLHSIEEFRSHNKFDYVIKVSKNQYGVDENRKIITLPFYYFSFFLDKMIEDGDLII